MKRHYCKTCTWCRVYDEITVPEYYGNCRRNPNGFSVQEDDFCGEHPEAAKERAALQSTSLDPGAVLSVAAGQFMGNYFSQALKEGREVDVSAEEDERTLEEIAKAAVEYIIGDFTNDEALLDGWLNLNEEEREEARRRWVRIIVNTL